MAVDRFVLALNTAGTLSIGSICFFIVYTTFRGINDQKIQEFSKRFLLAISLLIMYVSYNAAYNSFFSGSTMARYPMYLILVGVFLSLVYSAISLEEVAKQYGMTQSDKLDKMEKEELGA